jgi:hypothetical protein
MGTISRPRRASYPAASPSRLMFVRRPTAIGVNELDADFLKRSRLQEAIPRRDYA